MLVVLFVGVEIVVIVHAVWFELNCGEGCISEETGLYFAIVTFGLMILPVALLGLAADSLRSRIRFGAWRAPVLPARPDE